MSGFPLSPVRLWRLAIAAWHRRFDRQYVVTGTHYVTKAEDRIPFAQKVAYGAGAFVNNILAAAIGGMSIILNIGLGMNPALVGLLGALPRFWDALIDPLMGYVSDTTSSKWGRRRPYILAGALISAVVYAVLWALPEGRGEMFYFWYFLVGSLVFYVGYTIFATPWVALGYELTPDYHERTRLMGVQNFIGQIAYMISPWFLWIMTNKSWFPTPAEGARGLAIAIAVVVAIVGVIPALALRERAVASAPPPGAVKPVGSRLDGLRQSMRDFGRGFLATVKSRPFLRLCLATFLVFNAFIMVSSFQSYVIIYYIFGGNEELGARYAGWSGTVGAVSTFVVIYIVTWLATQIGKRKAFVVSTGISMFGYAIKWLCYDPERPLLLLVPAPFIAFGLGGLFTLMGAMIADVCDVDELETHQRREGMFGSIYWWVVKLGMAAALAVGGYLLNATGFDVALGGGQAPRTLLLLRLCDIGIPIAGSALAIWAIITYPITEARAHEVRDQLEARRGKAAVAPAAA